MRNYDTADLSNPATYAADPALATLVRRVIAPARHSELGLAIGDTKSRMLAGEYPDIVRDYVARAAADATAKARQLEVVAAAIAGMAPPAGYLLTLEGNTIVLSGEFNADLHTRIKRAGGAWDGTAGTNRRVWLIPASVKVSSLQRIFKNSAKATTEKAAASKVAAAATAAARQMADLERWLGYVEEKAPTGYLYERGVSECRMRGINQHPDLAARLAAAIDIVSNVKRRQQDAARAARSEQSSASQATTPVSARRLYPLSAPPALLMPVRLGGRAVVFTSHGDTFRINEDHPSTHGSHLLGYEGERAAYYYYRPATQEETAAFELAEGARARAAEQTAQRQREIAALRDHIRTTGDCPAGEYVPAGRVSLDTATIYGGGEWFVVGTDNIWYVLNNGADGDDWSRNNVRTGGAGAIGWRIGYDADIAARIEALERGDDVH